MDKQYYVDFEVNQEEVSRAIVIAEEFIAEMVNVIETVNEVRAKEYHQKAVALMTGKEK